MELFASLLNFFLLPLQQIFQLQQGFLFIQARFFPVRNFLFPANLVQGQGSCLSLRCLLLSSKLLLAGIEFFLALLNLVSPVATFLLPAGYLGVKICLSTIQFLDPLLQVLSQLGDLSRIRLD